MSLFFNIVCKWHILPLLLGFFNFCKLVNLCKRFLTKSFFLSGTNRITVKGVEKKIRQYFFIQSKSYIFTLLHLFFRLFATIGKKIFLLIVTLYLSSFL